MTGTLVGACDSGGSNGESSNVLIPLEEGNRWEAKVEEEPLDGERIQYSARLEVQSSTEVNRRTTFPDGRIDEETLIVEERSDRGVTIRYLYDSGDAPVMELRYPLDEGSSYQHNDGSGATYEVTVTRETVTVPAGQYDCVLYTVRDPRDGDLVKEIWVKPGMGPVRLVDEGGEEVWELTSTNVNS